MVSKKVEDLRAKAKLRGVSVGSGRAALKEEVFEKVKDVKKKKFTGSSKVEITKAARATSRERAAEVAQLEKESVSRNLAKALAAGDIEKIKVEGAEVLKARSVRGSSVASQAAAIALRDKPSKVSSSDISSLPSAAVDDPAIQQSRLATPFETLALQEAQRKREEEALLATQVSVLPPRIVASPDTLEVSRSKFLSGQSATPEQVEAQIKSQEISSFVNEDVLFGMPTDVAVLKSFKKSFESFIVDPKKSIKDLGISLREKFITGPEAVKTRSLLRSGDLEAIKANIEKPSFTPVDVVKGVAAAPLTFIVSNVGFGAGLKVLGKTSRAASAAKFESKLTKLDKKVSSGKPFKIEGGLVTESGGLQVQLFPKKVTFTGLIEASKKTSLRDSSLSPAIVSDVATSLKYEALVTCSKAGTSFLRSSPQTTLGRFKEVSVLRRGGSTRVEIINPFEAVKVGESVLIAERPPLNVLRAESLAIERGRLFKSAPKDVSVQTTLPSGKLSASQFLVKSDKAVVFASEEGIFGSKLLVDPSGGLLTVGVELSQRVFKPSFDFLKSAAKDVKPLVSAELASLRSVKPPLLIAPSRFSVVESEVLGVVRGRDSVKRQVPSLVASSFIASRAAPVDVVVRSRVKTLIDSRFLSDVKPDVASGVKIDVLSDVKRKTASESASSLVSLLKSRSLSVSRINFIPPKAPISKPPKPSRSKSSSFVPSGALRSRLFEVFVRQRGRDVGVGSFKGLKAASGSLFGVLERRLAASGFVREKGSGRVVPISAFGLRTGFRVSKVDPFRVVERRSKRLSTRSEVFGIQRARSRSLFGGSKGFFGSRVKRSGGVFL